jgi:hypothetical protein
VYGRLHVHNRLVVGIDVQQKAEMAIDNHVIGSGFERMRP